MSSVEFSQRVRNADATHKLIAALKTLETTKFDTMMGSGILVRLTPITEGKHLADEFLIAAEDVAGIAPLLAKSLRAYLKRRQVSLQCEIGEIGKALA